MRESQDNAHLLELTADIVTAYVSNNTIDSDNLPGLVKDVFITLSKSSANTIDPLANRSKPVVSIKKSVTDDYIICLEDGKKFKSLKRHLKTHYNLTPEEYRLKWKLPHNYPMVAPNYAKSRSQLARQSGLGKKNTRRKSSK